MWRCSECGKENDGKFCTFCGMPQRENEEASQIGENVAKTELLGEKEKMEKNEGQKETASGITIEQSAEAAPSFFSAEKQDGEFNSASALFRKNCGDSLLTGADCSEPIREFTPLDEEPSHFPDLFNEESGLIPDEAEVPSDEPEAPKKPLISPTLKAKLQTNKGITVLVLAAIVVLTAAIMIAGVIKHNHKEDEVPQSTGIYYYVSGVEEYASLYADNSIKSKELVRLENGDPVEFLYDENYKFAYVLDHGSGLYGYMLSDCLVNDIDAVDYGKMNNEYSEEESLGYYYVTKTESGLKLWENPDGGGAVKAKLKNGYKVSLLEETSDSYWYVFDYHSAERGYVKVAYLTDDEDKVVGVYKEPKDKTIIGDYFVTGVDSYLSLRSEPTSGASRRGKLQNGDKIGLVQKTTGTYWYVYSYSLDQYGYVVASYLTTEDPNQQEEVVEPEEPVEPVESPDQPATDPTTYEQYTVTGTESYLPVRTTGELSATEVGRIYNGDTVNVITQSSDSYWYVYSPTLGQYGYVLKQYLTK